MAKYQNLMPAGYSDEEDDDYFANEVREKPKVEISRENSLGIKVIKIEVGAGINRRDFDISLDENSKQWFDQIYQYWKQCK